MPPFGPLYKQPVVVDRCLTADPEILFNGGSHREAIRMRYRDFEELVKPAVADFGYSDGSLTSRPKNQTTAGRRASPPQKPCR